MRLPNRPPDHVEGAGLPWAPRSEPSWGGERRAPGPLDRTDPHTDRSRGCGRGSSRGRGRVD